MPRRRTQPPRRVRILNLTWKVKFVDNDIGDSLGWCDYESQTITLYAQQTKESLCDTFLHELLHALFYAMAIDQSTDEEKLVASTSTGLCAVWKQNPEAFKWWASML